MKFYDIQKALRNRNNLALGAKGVPIGFVEILDEHILLAANQQVSFA